MTTPETPQGALRRAAERIAQQRQAAADASARIAEERRNAAETQAEERKRGQE